MFSDWIFVIGCLLVLVGIAGLVSGWIEHRLSIVSAVMVVAGLAMVIWAWTSAPALYAPAEAPNAFIRVLGYVLRGN